MIRRKEIKYPFKPGDHPGITNYLGLAGLNPAHPSRIITSLYFDYPSLKFFHDSEEGLTPRYKVRLRWYDNPALQLKESLFEVKRTLSDNREKVSIINSNMTLRHLPEWRKLETKELIPILYVQYLRYYFSDHVNNRATLDVDIRYRMFSQLDDWREVQNPVFAGKDPNYVLEFKIAEKSNGISLPDKFSLERARFSKYCQGLSLMLQLSH